jgi:para-nitrobenzyl esterase
VAAIGCVAETADDSINTSKYSLEDDTEWVSDGEDMISVRTTLGKVSGIIAGNTREFLGIPYAKPPVGELRFAPPQPAEAWRGIRDASAFGPVCPQTTGAFSAPGTQSEDCLTLNVYTPLDAKKEKSHREGLPVMVFIHGGAFTGGAGSQYDAQKLSEVGHLVVVTVNYRIGALGFLSHPQLDQSRAANAPSGNDGLRDQQLALRWIKNNIGPFGGDADNVTIFGESAGSMSTCIHMVSPTSRDLAHQFIMESAVCIGGLPVIDKVAANTIGTNMGNALCSGETDIVACLRAKPVSELIAYGASSGISGAGWGPVYNANDPLLPTKPVNLIATGNYNKGPIMVGTNKNEWGLFAYLGFSPSITSAAAFSAVVDGQFGALAPYVKMYYPVASDAVAQSVYNQLMTDIVFRCPTRGLARLASSQGSNVYLYSFEQGAENPYLAWHAFEIPYVFGNANPRLGAPVLVESLRATVQDYWTQFAIAGDPNLNGQPVWPVYSAAADQHMTLRASSAAGSGLSQVQCNFWDWVATL